MSVRLPESTGYSAYQPVQLPKAYPGSVPGSSVQPSQEVKFGLLGLGNPKARKLWVDPKTGRVDDDIYHLISFAYKTELHIHQGGSSSISKLNEALRRDIEAGQIDELPLYHDDDRVEMIPMREPFPPELLVLVQDSVKEAQSTGGPLPSYQSGKVIEAWKKILAEGKLLPPAMIPVAVEGLEKLLTQGGIAQEPLEVVGNALNAASTRGKPLPPAQLRAAMEKVLTLDNLREYFRVASIADNPHRESIPNRFMSETTSNTVLDEDFDPVKMREVQKQGLTWYRQTSQRINPYVKNNPAFYKTAHDYAKDVRLENVRYSEYRVSPAGNGMGGNNGGSIEDVLSAASAGFADAKSDLDQRMQKFDYGLIVLFERQNRSTDTDPQAKVKRAVQLAKDVVRLKKEGKYNIVGVDLAGAEGDNPVNEFKEAFDTIKAYNEDPHTLPEDRLGITIHAGETEHSGSLEGWESIRESVKLAHSPHTKVRIGHGLQLVNSSPALKEAFETSLRYPNDWEKRINKKKLLAASPLLQYIRDNNIVLEMCPKSNLQTYGVHPWFADGPNDKKDKYTARSYRRHPAVFLSRLGVKVTLSSDNRTISKTDSSNEFIKLYKYAGLTYNDMKRMILDGFEGAFVSEEKRTQLLAAAHERFNEIERNPKFIQGIKKMSGKITLRQRFILLKTTIMDKVQAFWHRLKNWLKPAAKTKQSAQVGA